jgi:hypothetical protein
MKEETLKKYIGKTFGVITVLDLAYETYDKEKQCKRTYFKVHCNRCGKDSILRADALIIKGKNGRQDRKSCKLCYADLQREIADNKYAATRHFRNRLHSIIGNAKGRNISFDLTEEQVENIIEKPCFYCGKNHSDGIDRIDSTKPYTVNNCVPCCFICNRMKNKFSLDLFLDKVEKIYNLHCNKSSTTISEESTSQANGDGSGELLTAA